MISNSVSPKLRTYIFILISMIFWGMSFIWTDMLLQTGYPPIAIVLIRLIIVSILLVITAKILRKWQHIQPADVKWFLLMATLEPFLYFIGETYGIQITRSPTLAAVVVSTIPLFSPIAGYYFYKERISIKNFIGIALSVTGVCMVVFQDGMEKVNAQLTGILLFLLAVASAIFYSVVIKRLADKYNPFTIVAYQNMIGVVYFLPIFFAVDFKTFIKVPFSIANTYPLFMLAIFASGVAFVLFVYAIKELGVSRANIFTTLIPVLTAVFCFILGTERISPLRAAGICVVACGLILSQLQGRKRT